MTLINETKRLAAKTALPMVSRALRSSIVGHRTKDAIWKFAQRHMTYLDILSETTIKSGARMHVSSRPRVEQELYLFGEWEPLFTRYLLSRPKSDGIFLDIGANIGYFSILVSSLYAEFHLIEASPKTAMKLRANLSANNVQNAVVHEVAVGGEIGFVDFFQDNRQSGAASVIQGEHSILEARVPIAPLTDILSGIDWSRVKFVKIDVEGFEAPVLESLAELSDELPDDVEIFVEYDPARRDSWPAIQGILKRGFFAALMQGPYDRRDYIDETRRAPLSTITNAPTVFCDLLLRKAS